MSAMLALPQRAPSRLSRAAAAAPRRRAAAPAAALKPGDNVSSVGVTLTTNAGKAVTLSQLTTERGAVLFMYPRAATSGCTVQACGFRDNYAAIAAAGFDVYGLSLDPAAAQTAWAEEHALGYPLLTDTPEAAALAAFAALKPDDGSGALKILRSHAVVARGGAVLDVSNGVKSDESFGDALAFVTRHAAGQ